MDCGADIYFHRAGILAKKISTSTDFVGSKINVKKCNSILRFNLLFQI